MTAFRPILISTIHYHDQLLAGTMTQFDVARIAKQSGVDGVEFRDVYWQDGKANADPFGRLLTNSV